MLSKHASLHTNEYPRIKFPHLPFKPACGNVIYCAVAGFGELCKVIKGCWRSFQTGSVLFLISIGRIFSNFVFKFQNLWCLIICLSHALQIIVIVYQISWMYELVVALFYYIIPAVRSVLSSLSFFYIDWKEEAFLLL